MGWYFMKMDKSRCVDLRGLWDHISNQICGAQRSFYGAEVNRYWLRFPYAGRLVCIPKIWSASKRHSNFDIISTDWPLLRGLCCQSPLIPNTDIRTESLFYLLAITVVSKLRALLKLTKISSIFVSESSFNLTLRTTEGLRDLAVNE